MASYGWIDYYASSDVDGDGHALPDVEMTIDPDAPFSPGTGYTLYRTLVSASARLRVGHADVDGTVDGRFVRSIQYGDSEFATDLQDNGLPGIMWEVSAPEVDVSGNTVIATGSLAWTSPTGIAHTQSAGTDLPVTVPPTDMTVVSWIQMGMDPAGLASSQARRIIADSSWRPTAGFRWNDGQTYGNGVYYWVSAQVRARCLFRLPV